MKGIKTLLSVLTALMLAANSAAVAVSAAETGEEVTNEEIITEEFITEDEAEVMDLDGTETDIAEDMNSTVKSAGDVNKDGSIDSLDATKILINYAKYLNNGGKKPSTGDTNGDGIADSRDATAILVYYAEQLLGSSDSTTSYPKTATNDFSDSYQYSDVAKSGTLNGTYKYDIDSDGVNEVITRYTASGYSSFFFIYDNGKKVKNTEGNCYAFADFSTGTVSFSFVIMKSGGVYRAVWCRERNTGVYSVIGWDDIFRKTTIAQASAMPNESFTSYVKTYELNGSSTTYAKIYSSVNSYNLILTSSSYTTKSLWLSTLAEINSF